MAIRTELNLRLANSPGALTEVCRVLADERVRIHALMLEAGGTLRLVVDNPVRALGVLRERRHVVEERDVLVTPLPNTPGGMAPVLALARDAGINVEYAYAASPDSSPTAMLVLGVVDAARASMSTGL
jgi:hypothetical protein